MKATLRKYPELQGFFDFQQFNPIQTQCLPKIMEKQDNLIVSAPTSSGKTVLFELAILKYSHLPSPMCLYLAPIKSLCHEKYNQWDKKFSSKLSVVEVTGDTIESNQQKYFQSHITIGTPQKVDFLSRQSLEFLKKIRLLLIDQVHMLNFQERGATLEAIVSRIMSLNNKIRIIAVSATIPNIWQVAEWLKVPKNCVCIFGEEYRPVKINKTVLGFKSTGNPFTFERSLNFKLLEAVRLYSQGKGSLIFCPTQKGTQSACQQIISMMREREFIQNDKQLTFLIQAAKQISNSTLQIMIPQGLAFHNASLSSQDRNIVERLFLDLKIKVLCTTSTLSMGINLPARLVVIKSTQSYKGSMRGYQEYTRIEIDQMMGRAGRPPFDTEGTVVIMTEKSNFYRYNNKLDLQNLQSQLFSQMLEHLNAEISLGSIISIDDVYDYIRNSFCYIRMKKSPSSYGITGEVDKYIEDSCRIAIQNLAQLNIITYNPQTQRLFPRPLSNSISRSAVQIKSIANITKLCDKLSNQKQYLYGLCSCEQIGRYNSKVQERKALKAINQKNKYVLKEAISNSERKSFVLVQAQLSRNHIEFWQMRRQASDIITLLRRLNYCVKVLGLELKQFWLYYWAVRFQKYFSEKYWQVAEELTLLQFTGLQDKGKFLNLRGIKTLTEFKKNLGNISSWLQKGASFQSSIQQEINCYQKTVELNISTNEEKVKDFIVLKIKISCKFVGKLKGIHVCIGDSSNNLYFHRYLGENSKEVTVTFPKSNIGRYKIGIVKQGIIGFDQFFLLQKDSIVRFAIDQQVETKQANNRKSVDHPKKQRQSTNKQKRSKSHQIKNTQQSTPNHMTKKMPLNVSFEQDQQVQNDEILPNKGQKQLKLPPNYRIKQPICTPSFEDDPVLSKRIKKQQKFKYKPLNQYKWKPGFQQITSSPKEEKNVPMKSLKIVQSKNKSISFKPNNLTNIFSSKAKDIKLGKGSVSKIEVQSKKSEPEQQQQDVFSYFYNLF